MPSYTCCCITGVSVGTCHLHAATAVAVQSLTQEVIIAQEARRRKMQRLLRREATVLGAEVLTGVKLPAQQSCCCFAWSKRQSDCSWGLNLLSSRPLADFSVHSSPDWVQVLPALEMWM